MSFTHIYLPTLALALGVVSSIYLIVWWWLHRGTPHARAVFYWALALFFMWWFQVPAILVSLGRTITITDFNLFFALTFPVTFLAFILIYLGILKIADVKLTSRQKQVIYLWFAFAIAFFAYQFILNKGIIRTYLLPVVGNLGFYVVIRAIIIVTVIRLFKRPAMRTTAGMIGGGLVIAESILGLTRNFFIIDRIFTFPPRFWYVHIAQSQFFFVSQTVSVILLAIGFYFLHRVFDRRSA